MEIKTYKSWNKEHPNVGSHGNLKEDNGKWIFSCDEAQKKYPGSVKEKKMIKYTWKEYLESGRNDAKCFDVGLFAICNYNAKES